MKTLKELKALKTVNVIRDAGIGIEKWETMKKEWIDALEVRNREMPEHKITVNEKPNGLYFSNGQFVMKPKYSAKMVGTVEFRSSDYIFRSEEIPQGSYGNIPKASELIRDESGNITGWGVVTAGSSDIVYKLV